MTTGAALLQDLAGRGVVLTAESGRLRYRAPAGALTPDLRRRIEAHKAALLQALAGNAQQAGLFDGAAPIVKQWGTEKPGAAPSPDAGPLGRGPALARTQDGAGAPDLAEPDSRQITGNAALPLVARRGQDLAQDPHAARLVLTDFERARQRLAALEAELDASLAGLAHLPERQWPADLVARLDALAREALTLAPVAEYDSLAELETATGAAYQAVVKCPSDQTLVTAYARLDDAWAAVLGLPELPHEVPA